MTARPEVDRSDYALRMRPRECDADFDVTNDASDVSL